MRVPRTPFPLTEKPLEGPYASSLASCIYASGPISGGSVSAGYYWQDQVTTPGGRPVCHSDEIGTVVRPYR